MDTHVPPSTSILIMTCAPIHHQRNAKKMEQSSECIQKYELKLALLSTYGKPAFPLKGGSSINKSR